MKFLKWVIGIVVALALVIGIGGMLLPREVTVVRTVAIDAPASKVFPQINDLKASQGWSPWLALDPDVQTTFSEATAGVGATMSWKSDNPDVGVGNMEIVDSVENFRVVNSLDFGEMGLAEASFELVEADGKTTVVWALVTDMGAGPIGRWFGLKMDDWVGADFEKGLSNLKALVEG